MRIGIYDPYLNTLGGGERYVLTAAECLSKKHQVEVFWEDTQILVKAERRFNLDLGKIRLANNIFDGNLNTISRMKKKQKSMMCFCT